MQQKIIVIDDDPATVKFVAANLEANGYQAFAAFDGAEAIKVIEKESPDLAILDIMMPKLSGFEVCRRIKDSPQTRDIMVLMVTALNELGDIERAVAAGCDDFLSKPVNKFELLKRVENMLKLRHVTDELERLRRYIDQMEEASRPTRK